MSTLGSKTSDGQKPDDAAKAPAPTEAVQDLPPVHVPVWIRFLDLAALALALPIFILADLPIAGYLFGGGAWLVQRAVQVYVNRKAAASRDPRTIVGLLAGSMIARGWFCAIAIFVCGLLAGDNAGLAAAVLVVMLFTVYFGLQMALRPMDQPLKGVSRAAR